MNRLARVAVFVDQAIGRPGEIVFHLIGRELRQRADAQPHLVKRSKLPRQMMRRDGDESRRQAALRHEDLPLPRLDGDLPNQPGGFDVFGQIEIAQPHLGGSVGDGGLN